jgi:glycerol kinase
MEQRCRRAAEPNCASMAARQPTTCCCNSRPTCSGVPVVRPQITETTALGAAYLAGLAVGFLAGRSRTGRLWQAERRFEPAMAADQRSALMAGWRRAVERSLKWVEKI